MVTDHKYRVSKLVSSRFFDCILRQGISGLMVLDSSSLSVSHCIITSGHHITPIGQIMSSLASTSLLLHLVLHSVPFSIPFHAILMRLENSVESKFYHSLPSHSHHTSITFPIYSLHTPLILSIFPRRSQIIMKLP